MKCCIFIQSLQHSPNKTEMKGSKKVSTGPSMNTPLLEMQHLYQGHKPSIMTAAVFVLQFVGIQSPLLKSLLKLWQHKWSWTEPGPRVLHHFLGSKAERFSCVIMGGISRYCDEKKSSLKWKCALSTEHEPSFLFFSVLDQWYLQKNSCDTCGIALHAELPRNRSGLGVFSFNLLFQLTEDTSFKMGSANTDGALSDTPEHFLADW